MCVHKERRMGERAVGTVHEDDARVPEHWHDSYITREELKGIIARWAIGAVFSCLLVLGGIGIWAVRTGQQVDYDHIRMEEMRREGSLPVQQLKSDISSLTIQLQQVSVQLKEINERIQKVTR